MAWVIRTGGMYRSKPRGLIYTDSFLRRMSSASVKTLWRPRILTLDVPGMCGSRYDESAILDKRTGLQLLCTNVVQDPNTREVKKNAVCFQKHKMQIFGVSPLSKLQNNT